MFNLQSIKSTTLTAAIIGTTFGLSILGGANASQAANLTIPLSLESFTLAGNAQIVPTSSATPFFTSDMISLEGNASATSGLSPVFDIIKKKQTILHFNYAFFGGGTLSLLLNNIKTGLTTTTVIDLLSESTGTIADFDLTNFIDTGAYSVTHQLIGGGTAHFNNFTVVTKHVPEPSATLGLFGLGMAAFTLKNKRKFNVLVKAAS
ncbi:MULTISPECIES: PEP-CTERM sorting domain-containing protein [unclassified Anabaena]|uniref:PEP-CTERM sorting domain-containing protein n=1 Tax=unclassified Anabaena TaxID=2619674 RepID=UPI001448564F|nr:MULTISPECIES: PEP-CTERM sorting domain-containing protein [unclassified Anabaena]MTJ08895.1 PEP-CTERM sorting domain-containing protein [Anabaena sp. UHCC 0204]MTJ51252.1 PEP-CTERM sorting domain-containing protein [Anabaena sp. UHCC 0253]